MKYDLIVLGGGPAGYVAAERAGDAGMKVLLIEKEHLGGVCLNCGCIPSKTLLNSAKLYHHALHGEAFGVKTQGVSFDLGAVMARKAKVIETLRKGIAGIMKRSKVDVVTGEGRLEAPGRVKAGDATYEGANVLVCTGSSPARPPIPGIELPHVLNSTGMLSLGEMPRGVVVIGGGVIGCEFACFFGSLGVPVTVVEMLPEICPAVDEEIAKLLRQELGGRGIAFHVGAKVEAIRPDGVVFTSGGKQQVAACSHVLVATGRTTNVQNIGLEAAGVEFDRRGVRVDERCATNVPGIWAAGDVTGRQWLAHSASRMGEVAVHNMLGRRDIMRYHAIPGVVYTAPEVATVGLTEAQARAAGTPVKAAKMPLSASGRYLAEHDRERGLCKVLVHAETGALLGVHMLGGACSEMIFGAAAMIEMEVRVREIEEIVFPHPTVSEMIRETALMVH